MVARILGSPEKLADEVINKIRTEIETRMNEALLAAKQIVEKAYEEARKKLEEELSHALRDAREKISSFSAKWEVEHRKKLAEIRAKAVDEALQEALSRLRSYVGEESYIDFLARMLRDAFIKLPPDVTEIDIVPVNGDSEYVAKALKRVEKPRGIKARISEETLDGLGGFVVRAREGGLTLNYSLDVVLAPVIEEARSAILETLLGKEGV